MYGFATHIKIKNSKGLLIFNLFLYTSWLIQILPVSYISLKNNWKKLIFIFQEEPFLYSHVIGSIQGMK